jgi:hypothetical protein
VSAAADAVSWLVTLSGPLLMYMMLQAPLLAPLQLPLQLAGKLLRNSWSGAYLTALALQRVRLR